MAFTPSQLRQLRRADANGNRVRAARHLSGLTQVQLSRALGCTQSWLSDIERQRWASTDVETARRLSQFFGCTIEDLFPARQAVSA